MKTVKLIRGAILCSLLVLATSCISVTREVDFYTSEDPVCRVVDNLCDQFDVERDLYDSNEDAMVLVTYNRDNFLVQNVLAFDNETGNLIYERYLKEIDKQLYEVELNIYDVSNESLIAVFNGVVETDAFEYIGEEDVELYRESVSWIDRRYENLLDMYYFDSVVSGELMFYDYNYYLGKPVLAKYISIDDYEVSVSDYWTNGQVKLSKTYDKYDAEITSAANYNEDGTPGNPIEIASLLNDRWIGFSSNLVRRWDSADLFLILRADEDDWHYGRVAICYSDSNCWEDYTYNKGGNYHIDGDHIRFYNMREGLYGDYSEELRFSLSGTEVDDIEINGYWESNYARFVSDLDVSSRSWFKSSMESKYKMR